MKRADILSAVTAIALFTPASVWASEVEPLEELQEFEQAAKASLPQLDVGLYPGLLFWLFVVFVLFYLYVRYLGAPVVQKSLNKRASVLGTHLAAARAASDEAQKIAEENEAALSKARHHAQETVSNILIDAAKEEDERSATLQQELTHRTHVAEENIFQAQRQAMEEAPQFINGLVQDLFAKVTQVSMGTKPSKAG